MLLILNQIDIFWYIYFLNNLTLLHLERVENLIWEYRFYLTVWNLIRCKYINDTYPAPFSFLTTLIHADIELRLFKADNDSLVLNLQI